MHQNLHATFNMRDRDSCFERSKVYQINISLRGGFRIQLGLTPDPDPSLEKEPDTKRTVKYYTDFKL